MSQKASISKESKERLFKIMGETMIDSAMSIDLLSQNKGLLKEIQNLKEKAQLAFSDYEEAHRVYEYNTLLGLINLDLLCAYRYYLKAELSYEIIYSTKSLIVIIIEGYKKIYGYTKSKRNKSIWIKDIGSIIKNRVPRLNVEYENLTLELNSYHDEELDALKPLRDMFIHYDDNPSKLVDELSNLDIEIVSQKVLPFLEILRKMFEFINLISLSDIIVESTNQGKL